jgi:hypothetical protein
LFYVETNKALDTKISGVACSTNYTIRDRQLGWFKYVDWLAINDMIEVGASTRKMARLKYFVSLKKEYAHYGVRWEKICLNFWLRS